jgi:thiamine pyrophosphate-dependent acetolactate synthase large subunit-like protein
MKSIDDRGKMPVAEHIAHTLASNGIIHVYKLTCGGFKHMNAAVAQQPDIQVIFNHHEQACAPGGKGYARITSRKYFVYNNKTGLRIDNHVTIHIRA